MPNRDRFALRYETRMSADDVGEILIYSEIVSEKWRPDDPEVTAIDFDKALKSVGEVKRLNIRINSPGGDVDSAVAIRAMLSESPIPEKHIYIQGMCASAATLPASTPGCTVHIHEGSLYMIHNPRTWACGTASEIENVAHRLRLRESEFCTMYAKRCGKDEKTVKAWMDETKWFTATQALAEGFVDEIVATNETTAACVTEDDMRVMRALYGEVPENIAVIDNVNPADEPPETISNAKSGTEPAAAPENTKTNEEEHSMDMKDITGEQLMQERPDLFNALNEAGAKAERERMQEIDELTPPGYEEMAAEAKKNGESAMDYHKRVVKAQREKATEFLEKRNKETAGSKEVTGGATSDLDGDEAKMIDEHAKEIAAYAKAYHDAGAGTMF